MTGFEIAYAAEYRTGCAEIRVWHTADRGVRRYASHCFVSTSTGSGVSQIAVSRGRALWVTYTGGNIREYSLWTRTRGSKVRRLEFLTDDVDDPPPVVIGTADEDALVYSVGATLVALRPDGSRVFSWRAPARVRFSTAQGDRYTPPSLDDGGIYTLDARGNARLEARRDPATLVAAVWGTDALVIHSRGAVEAAAHRPVASNAGYEGFASGLYVYSSGPLLRLLRLRDGRNVAFARGSSPLRAGFDRLGIAYANGRTVTFDSWAVVSVRVRSR